MRYAVFSSTVNSARYRSTSIGISTPRSLLVFGQVIDVQRTERIRKVSFARVGEVVDQRDEVRHAHVCLGLLEVAGCRFSYRDGLEEVPQEPAVQAMLRQLNGTVVQLFRGELVQVCGRGHDMEPTCPEAGAAKG